MCIRHELSAEAQTSARVSRMHRSLSPSIAIDVSAFFTANVPPNPQHSSARGSSTRSIPRTARRSLKRGVAHPEHPERVAGRVIGHPVGIVGPDVLDAQLLDQELGQLEDLRGDRLDRAGQARVAGQLGGVGVHVPDHPHARGRGARRPPRPTRRPRRTAGPAGSPRADTRCCSASARSRSGPSGTRPSARAARGAGPPPGRSAGRSCR